MRTREILTAIGVTLLLVSACGPDRHQEPRDTMDVRTLQIKLRALATDACYREPATQSPHVCEKFVTQLGNLTNTIAAAGRTGHPELTPYADRMNESISTYRAGRCTETNPRSDQECHAALADLAQAADEVNDVLSG